MPYPDHITPSNDPAEGSATTSCTECTDRENAERLRQIIRECVQDVENWLAFRTDKAGCYLGGDDRVLNAAHDIISALNDYVDVPTDEQIAEYHSEREI